MLIHATGKAAKELDVCFLGLFVPTANPALAVAAATPGAFPSYIVRAGIVCACYS
jgi:hypothetical protein